MFVQQSCADTSAQMLVLVLSCQLRPHLSHVSELMFYHVSRQALPDPLLKVDSPWEAVWRSTAFCSCWRMRFTTMVWDSWACVKLVRSSAALWATFSCSNSARRTRPYHAQ